MTKTLLSIDPGVTSIGWTLTEQNEKRRAKRTTRRNKYRSNRRMAKLENYLIKNDFLSNHN